MQSINWSSKFRLAILSSVFLCGQSMAQVYFKPTPVTFSLAKGSTASDTLNVVMTEYRKDIVHVPTVARYVRVCVSAERKDMDGWVDDNGNKDYFQMNIPPKSRILKSQSVRY